jgi:xanthine dehydrogenase large subunit
MFVIESAIAKAAEALGIEASEIQKKNLLVDGDEFPYGQKAESEANKCWEEAEDVYVIKKLRKQVKKFNEENRLYKKGISFMPICFGISFTKTFMNQARALVHIYTDGSVGVSTGAVEMGQGVNTKMAQVAATIFSLPLSKIKIHTTNTFRIANTSPSAASATADLNGKAVEMACMELMQRLKPVAEKFLKRKFEKMRIVEGLVHIGDEKTDLSWGNLIAASYMSRVNLSEHAHYAPPQVHFDPKIEKGHPFAYHVYGTAITVVTVDCLRGIYTFDAVKVVHDFGSTMNPVVDLGQIEGGIVQGMGWMTMEEIIYDKEGRLRSNALSTYKVPDIYSVPEEINVQFLKTKKDNLAIFRSKAVGEPPLMYGIGAYFAIRNAVKAFNPSADVKFSAPITPEKVLIALYPKKLKASQTAKEVHQTA